MKFAYWVVALATSVLMLMFSPNLSAQEPIVSVNETIVRSDILDENRPIIVSLPDGYEDSDANYPVLYMLDGRQNMLHAIATMDTLSSLGFAPKMIFVGIVSTNRSRDYTPSVVEGDANSGGAANFLAFLETELIPSIEQEYRTSDHRILEGHSFGGLFGAYALMERPDLFDAYIILSPALWWGGEEMNARAKTYFADNPQPATHIYFGIGQEDGDGMRQELGRFVETLETAKPEGLIWRHDEIAGEDHMSVRLPGHYQGLRYVFEDLQFTMADTGFTIDDFIAHEANIRARYGTAARQREATYHDYGMALLQAERADEAAAIFEYLVQGYPGYHPNYNFLATAYEKLGRCESAIAAYEDAAKASTTQTGTFTRAGYEEKATRLREAMANGAEMCKAE
ncbi:alpha/beta hydrolase [Alterisphingorhabdus coralli]|uniref:Alpha/beta hydrolase-fold protein n=1 Tax=Alterisphingorhabdus coralli TaxID=3071408 RepID=A0AA97I087_9SPHN|nr:alpha/beta hydrolase-fold protein [Parasphingorhabdus sp. SCSIO 66989]WOE74642.1 alpha/beta hydrolase-fold protein [Parasphingorhabdus sp. SCSIO 66989]